MQIYKKLLLIYLNSFIVIIFSYFSVSWMMFISKLGVKKNRCQNKSHLSHPFDKRAASCLHNYIFYIILLANNKIIVAFGFRKSFYQALDIIMLYIIAYILYYFIWCVLYFCNLTYTGLRWSICNIGFKTIAVHI